MRSRAFTHLAIATAVAAGAVTVSLHLAGNDVSADVVATAATSWAAPPSVTLESRRTTGARSALRQLAVAPAAATPTMANGAGVSVVDESKPHSHVVDPTTGGLISVAGAVGTVPAAHDLGPMHADPMPAGVDLTDPTDTGSLLERAGVVQAELAAAGQPVTAGASAPIGTPGIATLTAHVAPSCTGTGTDGKRVQVLYAHEASTPSRYADVLPLLRNEVANVDDVFAVSSEQTGGGRRVRWVHDADCLPVITDVTVPDDALGPDFWATVTALKTLGYDDPDRKYIVFADANQFCGIGTLYNDLRLSSNYNDGYAASFARVDANCWSTAHSVPAHELTHNLGGVQQGAPHATTNGHCYDDADIMCYDDGSGIPLQQVCGSAQEDLLDCNHDDYFNTDPAPGTFLADNWNTASSSFLDVVPVLAAPPDATLGSSTAAAETGDTVTFTATSTKSVSWTWSTTSACALTPAGGTATMVCPSTVTGSVPVTATATDGGGSASATQNVSMAKAAAPTVHPTAPSSATTGTPVPVTATVTGKSTFSYAWSAGSCTVADPAAAATTLICPAGSGSENLPLSVTVTQADGQSAVGTTYVAVTGATGAPPARTATAWSAPKVAKNLTASLSAGKNAAVSGVPVTVEVMWAGASDWVELERVVTDNKGAASVTGSYPTTGTFRFAYDGDATHVPATSSEVSIATAKTAPGQSKQQEDPVTSGARTRPSK